MKLETKISYINSKLVHSRPFMNCYEHKEINLRMLMTLRILFKQTNYGRKSLKNFKGKLKWLS
jgi:DNA-directed RNA polymerase alpha subunit